MILSKDSILKAVKDGVIGIAPFTEENLKEASYTFTLAPKLLVRGSEVTMDEEGYELQPKKFVVGYTNEKLVLNGKYGCILSTRGSVAQKGVAALLSDQYCEPDTDNIIALAIYNASHTPYKLEVGLKIVKGIFAPVI